MSAIVVVAFVFTEFIALGNVDTSNVKGPSGFCSIDGGVEFIQGFVEDMEV